MRRVDFKVPIYDWTITIVTIYDRGCRDDVAKVLDEFNLPMRKEVLKAVEDGSFNGGKTFSRKTSREEVVILFPWKSEEDFIRTLNHEKRHVIDDISEWHDLTCPESVAYLDGYVSCEIFKRLGELK